MAAVVTGWWIAMNRPCRSPVGKNLHDAGDRPHRYCDAQEHLCLGDEPILQEIIGAHCGHGEDTR